MEKSTVVSFFLSKIKKEGKNNNTGNHPKKKYRKCSISSVGVWWENP